jgi:hypothetical protein
MYVLTVFVHSVMRWVVVVLGILAVLRAMTGRSGQQPWTWLDVFSGLAFIVALDLQLVIGVVLFLYSPITILGRHELDLAVRSSALRFYTFEHPIVMAAAIVLAHIAAIRIRRHSESAVRRRNAMVFFGLALLLVLAGIPWPFLPYGRPLLSMLQ